MSFLPISPLAKEIQEIDDQLFFLDEDEDADYIATLQSQLAQSQATMQNKIKYCLRLYAYNLAAMNRKNEALVRIEKAAKARQNKSQSLNQFIFESLLHSLLEKVDGDFCSAIATYDNVVINRDYQSSRAEIEIEAMLDDLAEIKFNIDVAKDIEEQAIAHRKALQAKEAEFKKAILEHMQANKLKKVDGGMLSATYSAGRESVAVLDDSFLPDDCIKTEIVKTPIKAEIKKHLDAGEVIQGVEIVKTPYITVR